MNGLLRIQRNSFLCKALRPRLTRSFAKKRKKVPKVQLPGQGVGLLQGIQLCRQFAWANFTESLECSLTLNIDPRKANQKISTALSTPFSLGKKSKILVFSNTDGAKALVEKFGALCLSGEELDDFKKSNTKLNFTNVLTTSDIHEELKLSLGRILGPKKLMPNKNLGTVAYSLEELENKLEDIQRGSTVLKNDRLGNVRFGFGRLTLSDAELLENLVFTILHLLKCKPEGTKGKFFISAAMSSSMGPGVKLNPRHVDPNSMFFRQPVDPSEVEIEIERMTRHKESKHEKRKMGRTRHPCKREDGTYMTMSEYAQVKEAAKTASA